MEMKRRGLFVGAYWLTMHTTFFATVSILHFILENPNNHASRALLRDAVEGKEVLARFAKRSTTADRYNIILNVGGLEIPWT